MELDAPAEYHDLESSDESYHSVSALAGVALVLGVLSPLAFAHELLWSVPIAGVALAIVALVQIDRSGGSLIGRKGAVIGLVLALFCGLGAMTQDATRRLWLTHRATQVAERFVQLMSEGKNVAAYQLWARPQFRAPASVPFEKFYSENPEAAKDYKSFQTHEIIKDLVALGARAEIVHLGTHWTDSDPANDFFMVFYHLSGDMPDKPIDEDFRFVVIRSYDKSTADVWRVYSAELGME
jgi:hypothetical protein